MTPGSTFPTGPQVRPFPEDVVEVLRDADGPVSVPGVVDALPYWTAYAHVRRRLDALVDAGVAVLHHTEGQPRRYSLATVTP